MNTNPAGSRQKNPSPTQLVPVKGKKGCAKKADIQPQAPLFKFCGLGEAEIQASMTICLIVGGVVCGASPLTLAAFACSAMATFAYLGVKQKGF